MQIYHRRLVAPALTAVALAVLLASCGGSSNSSASSSGPTPGATTGAPITEASAADVDAAFVREMTLHGQMTVSAANIALTKSEHSEVKTLAESIIASKTEEVAQLKAIAEALNVIADKPTENGGKGSSMRADAATLAIPISQMGMSMDRTKLAGANPFDQAFIAQMTEHLEGALTMAEAELKRGNNTKLRELATAIIATQRKQTTTMATWNNAWYPSATGAETSRPDRSRMLGM